MVKHVAIIGCVILSLSAALIVPTSCSPIGKNEQKETNLEKSRLKRSTYTQQTSYPQPTTYPQTTVTSSASSSSAASSQTGSDLLLLKLLPYLTQYKYPYTSTGGYDYNGLAGLLKGLGPALSKFLYPVTGSLSSIVGGLGAPVDNIVGGLGKTVPLLTPILGPTGDALSGLLGMKIPSQTSTGAKTTPISAILPYLSLLGSSKSTANSQAETTVTQG